MLDREAAGGRNKYRGIRVGGVECSSCQAFQRRSWPLFGGYAGDVEGVAVARSAAVVVDEVGCRC